MNPLSAQEIDVRIYTVLLYLQEIQPKYLPPEADSLASRIL